MAQLTREKAKEILKDGTIRGKPITEKQVRLFGFIAEGNKPVLPRTRKSILNRA